MGGFSEGLGAASGGDTTSCPGRLGSDEILDAAAGCEVAATAGAAAAITGSAVVAAAGGGGAADGGTVAPGGGTTILGENPGERPVFPGATDAGSEGVDGRGRQDLPSSSGERARRGGKGKGGWVCDLRAYMRR